MYEKKSKKTKNHEKKCTKVPKSAKKGRNLLDYALFDRLLCGFLLQLLVTVDGAFSELLLDADELVVLGHAVAARV